MQMNLKTVSPLFRRLNFVRLLDEEKKNSLYSFAFENFSGSVRKLPVSKWPLKWLNTENNIQN